MEQASVVDRSTEALAARINAEHRACEAALSAALDHALAAGELLLQAKSEVSHGGWRAWVEENFESSIRTAQDYIRLASRRTDIEEAKAQRSAYLSINEALQYLKSRKPAPPLEREQEAQRIRKERTEQRLNERAELAIRTGAFEFPPPDLGISPGKWDEVVNRVLRSRRQNLPKVLDALGHEFHILICNARPEELGRFLATPINNPEEAERRDLILEELRAGKTWLAGVLEVVEANTPGMGE